MNQARIEAAVENALARRNILDEALGNAPLSRNQLNRIVDEAMIDGISSFELAAARDLASRAHDDFAMSGSHDLQVRAAAYAMVNDAFRSRASEFTIFVSKLIR
jgi:hypothetical protein